jgi:hypothetical protein
MRPAGDDTTYIATIADRDGWLFEHIVDAPSQAAAARELREVVRYWGMTLIEMRPAPIATHTPARRPRTCTSRSDSSSSGS